MTAATMAPELPGLTFQRHIGTGGFAEVYLYEQQVTGQKVAVKVLTDDGLDEELQARFFAEAKTTAELADHPSIVTVYTADITAAGRPYLVMQYYPKPNLAVRCRAKAFSVREVLQIGVQLAGAVETAHRAGILHRDIKPANVLTDAYDAPGLTDFGIAGRSGTTEGSTAEAMSVPWSPPEVLDWLESDERADVYSLGATLYHLLAGRSPFELKGGPNGRSALIDRIKREAVPDLPRDDVPDSLTRLLKQCMAKVPTARPASALALGKALRAIQQEQRLQLTPLVVREDEVPADAPSDAEDDGLATRARPPTIIHPDSVPRASPFAPVAVKDPLSEAPGPTSGTTTAPAAVSSGPALRPVVALPASTAAKGVAADVSVGLVDDISVDERTTRPGASDQAALLDAATARPSTKPVGRSRATPPRSESRARAAHPGASELEQTSRRKGVAPSPANEQAAVSVVSASPAAGRRPKSLALVGVAVVAVVASVGAFALTRSPSHAKPSEPSRPSAQQQDALAGQQSALAPGVPTVRAVRKPGEVTFSWTYDNPQTGDRFVLRRPDGGGQDEQSAIPTLKVTTSKPSVCLEVRAVRSSGLASPFSEPVCG